MGRTAADAGTSAAAEFKHAGCWSSGRFRPPEGELAPAAVAGFASAVAFAAVLAAVLAASAAVADDPGWPAAAAGTLARGDEVFASAEAAAASALFRLATFDGRDGPPFGTVPR